MPLVHLHVVHVGLPVLDETCVVTRHHPLVIVTPNHGTDGRFMSLSREQIKQASKLITITFKLCLFPLCLVLLLKLNEIMKDVGCTDSFTNKTYKSSVKTTSQTR